MREISFTQALDEAMAEEMRRDERVIALATARASALEKEFGAKRVRFTPISEAAFTGIGLGAAGSGYMFGGQADFPVTYRCTTGGGAQTAAQHSQSPYSMFMHLAGLKVILPSTPFDAKGLLKSAIRDNNAETFLSQVVSNPFQGLTPETPGSNGATIARRRLLLQHPQFDNLSVDLLYGVINPRIRHA